jgi:hypothetical protein
MLLSGAFQFPPPSTAYGELPSSARRLHKSPTSSGHKKINLVLKYSANEVSFSDPAIVTGIGFIE